MQWSKVLLAMGLGLSMLCVKAESQTGTVHGDSPDAVVHFSNKTDSSYSMHAATSGSWVFTEDFDWSGPNGWYSDAKFTISCERLSSGATAFVDASLCFGASMNGRMYIPGEEDGGTVPWSVSAAYHAAPLPYIWPAEAILAVGEEKSFRYGYDNVFYTNPGGFWKYNGMDVSGSSVQITWQNVGANYNLPSTLQAGQYMLTAARNTQGAFSANASATVVGVKQIAATSGSTTVTSTTDSPGANETLYVAKGATNITITATPEPGSAWPTNMPTWEGATGNGATATFTPSSAGETVITVTCGTSKKKIKIVVIDIDSLTREKTYTARKPSSSSPIPIITGDITNIITVKTNPIGFEDKVELILSGAGSIVRDSQNKAKWTYEAPPESKSDIGVKEVDSVTINSKILNIDNTANIKINITSVFNYYGTKNNDRDNAWKYAKWKYDISISNLNSVSYDPARSTEGWTNNYTNNMTLGPGAFAEEWSCASIIGHENVHGGQPFFMNNQSKEQEASMWELDHSNAPSCKASPITYIYDYCRYYYNDTKAYYTTHGGTAVYP